jgi:HSP20 family molecular chaperone IbpA
MTLLANLTGVKSDDLNIDLRDNVLILMGDVAPWEGAVEENLLIEY